MKTKLTRRHVLRLAALGGTSWLIAACTSEATQPTAPAQLAQAPATTVAPTTAVERAPTTQSSATSAPAPTSLPAATSAPAAEDSAAPTTSAAQSSALASGIAQAATQFLASLDDSTRTKATYTFDDAERQRWHWTTPSGFPRNGLPLREMNQDQRGLALTLLRASVSEAGYQKALDIMSLQNELGNDPELYYVTIFGAPSSADPWGWRFEGHHLSRHFTLVGEQVAATPFFNGSWPTTTDAGLRAMAREEDAARELIHSLDDRSRAVAIFQSRTLTNHVTQNQPYVSPLEPVGIPTGELSADQQKLVLEIIQTYLGVLPASIGTPSFERIQSAGIENVRFGWAGNLEPRRPHYYRLQGPTFLMEFDNSRNGGTHIHSVWRDFERDFGQHLR
jgi:Protein of unknown function (DUF3500)